MTTTTLSESIPGAGVNKKTAADQVVVQSVTHWSNNLFSFKLQRPESLRFRSGEFVMLGLEVEKEDGSIRPLLRAYSIASPNWEEEVEFYSIKVENGPLTSRLQHIEPGSSVILKPKPVGTLVLDALKPAKNLWLFATGTGIAPFVSLVRDPETYEKYDHVYLIHTCRKKNELLYGKEIVSAISEHEFLAEITGNNLTYLPLTTSEKSISMGRITDRILDGSLVDELHADPLEPENNRSMICGSLAFNEDMIKIMEDLGFKEGTDSNPGSYVVEKAFVG